MSDYTLSLPRLIAPINTLLEPGIRLGLANPLPFTSGFVVLEVAGRRSGTLRSVPLLCADCGCALLVSTVREQSHWIVNLAAAGHAHVWLRGRRRAVQAAVFHNGGSLNETSKDDGWWVSAARNLSAAAGMSVAALTLG